MRARERLWIYVQLVVAAVLFAAVVVIEVAGAFP